MTQHQDLQFRADKTAFWAPKKTLLVADLHLEKGSFYASTGQMLPPYDTKTTLARLQKAIIDTGAERLIALGDNFHDPNGPDRLDHRDRNLLPHIETIWIIGNHDEREDRYGELSTASVDHSLDNSGDNSKDHSVDQNGYLFTDTYEEDGFTFCHIASENDKSIRNVEISGHFHPKASVRSHGRRLSGPCFLSSKDTIIFPSFGAYTGGLDIQHSDIQSAIGDEYDIHICWKDKIFRFSKDTYLKNAA